MKTKIYIGEERLETGIVNNKIVVIEFLATAFVNDEIRFDYFPFYPSPSANLPRISIFRPTRVFSGEVTIDADPVQQAINYVTAFNLDYNSAGQFNVSRIDNIVTISATNGSPLTNPSVTSSFANVGNEIVYDATKTTRFIISFSGNPSIGDSFAFDIKKNNVVLENVDKTFASSSPGIFFTILGSTPEETASNLATNLATYDTDPSITYSVSQDDPKLVFIDVVSSALDVLSIKIYSNSSSQVTILGPVLVNNIQELVTDYRLLDLFEDENVELTSKLSDIEKLSNVFTDFSNSFSVPATANNNEIFRHYYDVDVDNTFNANIRVNGYIEIDSFPFRFGKVQLEGIKLKNQKPDTYKITFYGAVIQISDLFSDDTIDKLDYDSTIENNREIFTKVRSNLSQFDYEYNTANFFDSLNTPSFKDGNVITPLIAYANREWNYGSATSIDISTDAGAILESELRPSLRVMNIIEAIEAKYDISFSRNFFGSAQFNNLYIWLNQQTEDVLGQKEIVQITTPLSGTPDAGNVLLYDNYVYITRRRYSRFNALEFIATVNYEVYPTDSSVTYNAYLVDENGGIVKEWLNVSGNQSFVKEWKSEWRLNGDETEMVTEQVQLVIQSTQTLDFTVDLNVTYIRDAANMITVFTDLNSTNNSNIIFVKIIIEDNLPKLKVLEFFQGIMKMFKLIIRPLSNNQFYVNTLDGYYSDGNILDITPYIDQTDINIERPLIYKDIKFKYQKTNNLLGKQFRETNDPANDEIGYGDLRARFLNVNEKNELNVELPFENMLFERMSVLLPSANAGSLTNITIGQSISTSDFINYSKNSSRPILFYNNGIVNSPQFPIKVKFRSTTNTLTYFYNVGNTNDELIEQVTDTINWGAEVDPWHLTVVENSLYKNYWENWVETIYDLKQRKFTYEGYLPPRFIEELSLNDRLIIGSNRYKINDYKINLLDGKTELTLFNDIFEWNDYSFPTVLNYNARKFTANGWYMTDYINKGDSAYIYGSFTGYNSTSFGRIIKLLPNGDADNTFNTGSGFNNNTFGFQSIVEQADGKILATGDFTSFSGVARNRIARLNTDGSLDTSFVVGTGFNSITSGIDVDSQGRIVVCGSYSSYSGVSANRIIRLTTGGTVDSSFSYGTGFNNVTNSVVINSDDSMYVGGYFSSYNGTSSNRIIKLSGTGAVDTSFNVGTGLNSNTTNQPVGLISDGNDGVYVYGHFTTYSGISANRFTKLLPTGQIDPTFNIGTGFNASVVTAFKVLDDKLMVYGTFTQFNGLSVPNGIIVLNSNGGVYRTFSGNYVNVFTIGDRFYGNLANGNTELIADESLPILSTDTIITNAGVKYYGINVLKNQSWTITPIDLGYGTSWVTILTNAGTGVSEVVIRVEEKESQSAPEVYQSRFMNLRFNFNGVYRDVTIIQNGLEQ